MDIRKVTEGAYFVPSYSVQTLVGFHPGIMNQGVAIEILDDGDIYQTPLDGVDNLPGLAKEVEDAKPVVIA